VSGLIPVEIARQQLGELISILGELRNAGPRDQRFKQWRQITVTLLQRIWADDPSRADRFRRIPFSAPTGRADRNATRDFFERGCKEASTFLVELARELGLVVDPIMDTTDGESVPMTQEGAVADLPERDVAGGGGAADEAHASDDATTGRPAQDATPPSTSAAPTGPRPRLKDMLGFGDAHGSATPAYEATPTPTPDHTRARDVTPPPAASPVRFKPVAPVPVRDERTAHSAPPAAEPPAAYTPPAPTPGGRDPGRDLAAEFVLDSAVLQSQPRSAREPEVLFEHVTLSPAAQDIMDLAELVGELGVPARERAILRASLIDLARQMDTPSLQWDALRDTVAFAMQYPGVARRLMPLVMPYLDLAA